MLFHDSKYQRKTASRARECYNEGMNKDEQEFAHWKRWLYVVVAVLVVVATILVDVYFVQKAW